MLIKADRGVSAPVKSSHAVRMQSGGPFQIAQTDLTRIVIPRWHVLLRRPELHHARLFKRRPAHRALPAE